MLEDDGRVDTKGVSNFERGQIAFERVAKEDGVGLEKG